MAKPRKMLGSAESPYILSLMSLIETQSRETIAGWCVDYAESHIMGIYEKAYPNDNRLKDLIACFREFQAGNGKTAHLKKAVAEVNAAAKEAGDNPGAQAAAKTVIQAVASAYTPTHSLGLAFYGAAAIAYDRAGLMESADTYDRIAAKECRKMEEALRKRAVPDEKNPAKINWYCN